MQNRWKSWALWLAIASLIAFVVLNATGVDISAPLNTMMALLLPVLVAFGIINDPSVRGRLFSEDGQKWYQSWAVWIAIAALIVYCVKFFFKLDIEATVNSFMEVLLPVLIAFGIIKSPIAPNNT